jgi:TrkA domain protein
MSEVRQIDLPGIGVRYEFTTAEGERLGVLVHRSGRRDVLTYRPDDPDECATVLELDAADAQTLVELLGASTVSEHLTQVQQRIEGLAIEWLHIEPDAPWDGVSLGSAQVHTTTGVSIVAIVRGDETVVAPGPDDVLRAGDTVVAVGSPGGLDRVRPSLRAG